MTERANKLSTFRVLLIMIALSFMGIAFLPYLNIQYTPSPKGHSISVSFRYADASPEVVEADATCKIEGVLAGIHGVTSVSSSSAKGYGKVTTVFRGGTDMEAARFEVASAIRNIYPNLPSVISYPEISISGEGKKTEIVYIFKADIPSREIAKYLEKQVVTELASVPGVDNVTVGGSAPFQWVITFNASLASSAGISASDIVKAFESYYGDSVIGIANEGSGVFTVRLREKTGEGFGQIPVKSSGARIIHLGDIADWRYEESVPQNYYRVNGLNTVALSLGITSTANMLRTIPAIKEKMEDLQRTFPSEISSSIVYDPSEYVMEELSKIFRRTILCVLILLVFVFLFSRSWRYVLIVIFTLLVNVLTALAMYAIAGLQIHIYTLAGITVSLGIIIDTSIVMIDHYSYFKNRKVFKSILSAIATTVGALLIILLLPEKEKINLIDFVGVIIINLFLSLLISYLFVPALMEYMPVRTENAGMSVRRKRRTVKRGQAYSAYIDWGIRHRWVYILVFIIAFGVPLCLIPDPLPDKDKSEATLYRRLIDKVSAWSPYASRKTEIDRFFSSSFGLFYKSLNRSDFYRQPSKKQLYINAGMSEGCTVNQLNEVVKAMENYIAGFDEVSLFTTTINSYRDATIVVEFKAEFENTDFPFLLKSEVTKMAIDFGGANWRVYGIDDNFFNNNIVSGFRNYDISLTGYNFLRLKEYAKDLYTYLEKNPRVLNMEIWSGAWNARPGAEFVLDYDFEKMTAAGINPYSYYGTLSSVLYDDVIGRSDNSGDNVQVVLRSSDSKSYDLWHVLNSPIEADNGKITLSNVGSIEKKHTELRIEKHDQSYQLKVVYDFMGSHELEQKNAMEAVAYMNNEILPIGYKAERSEWGWFNTNKEQYAWLILLVIAIIYIILVMTFESFRYPFAVIFMIPISFIGVFLVFGLSDLSFDQGGFAALVMLSGIVVNAGIYLISTYQELLSEQKLPDKNLRLRISLYVKAYLRKIVPISLTVLSTIFSLIPFLIDSPEEVFWFDFAVGTIIGLIFSIIALLLFLPVFSIRKK